MTEEESGGRGMKWKGGKQYSMGVRSIWVMRKAITGVMNSAGLVLDMMMSETPNQETTLKEKTNSMIVECLVWETRSRKAIVTSTKDNCATVVEFANRIEPEEEDAEVCGLCEGGGGGSSLFC
ncbi:hypothetical protein Tco_0707390 [Tanacetum coccineum]|uniref:Uncharacterized protein n=1 Tax=Tanacetum coccineum TaxID=301880 RepID=A0ABQ4YA27_9ASTR